MCSSDSHVWRAEVLVNRPIDLIEQMLSLCVFAARGGLIVCQADAVSLHLMWD